MRWPVVLLVPLAATPLMLASWALAAALQPPPAPPRPRPPPAPSRYEVELCTEYRFVMPASCINLPETPTPTPAPTPRPSARRGGRE